jgi:hypothetical protein
MPPTPNNFPINCATANYGDIIYKKLFSAFNGFNDSVSAKIVVKVDPDGIIKSGNDTSSGAVPGMIQFFTANDSGNLKKVGEFDKAGRLITYEHWSVTGNPSGNPLLLMLNTDDPGNGAALSLRRSRGTYDNPKSVSKDDLLFKISWYAHDGQSYKETSSIHSKIEGDVKIGSLPTSITFKVFDPTTGIPADSLKINSDKSTSVQSLSALNASVLSVNSPMGLVRISNEDERDRIMQSPLPGTIIFVSSLDTVQVYTKNQGWKSLF